MTADQFASLVRGRRVGRGKWMGYCPAHRDRNRSLSVVEGREAVLVKCWSQGCETKDILGVMGLKFGDLFYVSRKGVDPEIVAQIRRAQRKQELEAQLRVENKLQAYRMTAVWQEAVNRMGKLLMAFPSDDNVARMFEYGLGEMRRWGRVAVKNGAAGMPVGDCFKGKYRITVEDVGSEIAGRLGLYA